MIIEILTHTQNLEPMFRSISRFPKISNRLPKNTIINLRRNANTNAKNNTKKPNNEEIIVLNLKYPKSFNTLIDTYKKGFYSWKANNVFNDFDKMPQFYQNIADYVIKIGTFVGFSGGCIYYYNKEKGDHSKVNLACMTGFGIVSGLFSAIIFVPISMNWPVTVPILLLLGTMSQINV